MGNWDRKTPPDCPMCAAPRADLWHCLVECPHPQTAARRASLLADAWSWLNEGWNGSAEGLTSAEAALMAVDPTHRRLLEYQLMLGLPPLLQGSLLLAGLNRPSNFRVGGPSSAKRAVLQFVAIGQTLLKAWLAPLEGHSTSLGTSSPRPPRLRATFFEGAPISAWARWLHLPSPPPARKLVGRLR